MPSWSERKRCSPFGAEIATSDLDDFFSRGQLDAALVCTPHPVHEKLVVARGSRGACALRKTGSDSFGRSRWPMIEATDTAGVSFGVIFQRRFWPAAQRIRRAIDAGQLES